jgi:hypothetical protein
LAVKEDVERIRQNAQNIDPKIFDSSEFKYASLERLVQKRVLITAAQRLHLEASDQRLAAELMQTPVLAALRQPDGKIDEARYKDLLAPQGLTPQTFEARVRSDLSVQQVQSSLVKSGMVPAALADVALNAYFEKREVQILKFAPEDFAKRVIPKDAEIEAFYKSNAPLFQAAEKASIQYVVLDLESIKKTMQPSEADLKAFYEQLKNRKNPETKSFAELRSDIEDEVKQQMAQKKYSEAAEIFINTVYEQSDSLKPVADKLKLEIQTAQNVTRQALPNQRGPLANTKFLGVLFAADSVDKKRNTEAVELGGSQLIAGRIVRHTPAQTLPFTEVKDRVQALLTERMSAELARKEGAAKFAELTAASVSDSSLPKDLSGSIVVSRDAMLQQNPKLVDLVLKASTSKLPTWVGVDLGAEGYRIVYLTKVLESAQALATQNRDQYLQVWSTAESASYYEYLKDKFKVQIKVSKPEAKVKTS